MLILLKVDTNHDTALSFQWEGAHTAYCVCPPKVRHADPNLCWGCLKNRVENANEKSTLELKRPEVLFFNFFSKRVFEKCFRPRGEFFL